MRVGMSDCGSNLEKRGSGIPEQDEAASLKERLFQVIAALEANASQGLRLYVTQRRDRKMHLKRLKHGVRSRLSTIINRGFGRTVVEDAVAPHDLAAIRPTRLQRTAG